MRPLPSSHLLDDGVEIEIGTVNQVSHLRYFSAINSSLNTAKKNVSKASMPVRSRVGVAIIQKNKIKASFLYVYSSYPISDDVDGFVIHDRM